jgi:hypothetical protein
LKEKCRSEFESISTALSATQQQVNETLRHMGLSVDEVRCPKSGYSIDMLATAHWGREARSAAACAPRKWKLMVLRIFFASKAFTGANGAGEREQYHQILNPSAQNTNYEIRL